MAWPWFGAIVYSAIVWLAADFAWRCITASGRSIGLIVLAIWVIGLLIILGMAS